MGKRTVSQKDVTVTHFDMVREYQVTEKKRKIEPSAPVAKLPSRAKQEKGNTSSRPASVERASSQTTTFDLDADESSDEEDWEEVDIDPSASSTNAETGISVSFEPGASIAEESVIRGGWDTKGTNVTSKKGKGKRTGPKLSREERQRRIQVHQIHIMALLKHASIRNAWANDLLLQMQLRETVPATKLTGLTPDKTQTKMVRTAKFYESLKYLLQQWAKIWYTDSRGLHKRDFNELDDINPDSYDPPVTKAIFNKKVIRHRGSRDLKVQGFVALLRAVGVQARLVVSLQPLDFASNTKVSDLAAEKQPAEKASPSVLRKPKFSSTSGQSKSAQRSQSRMHYSESPTPVYWVEVFEPTGQKWVSLDPACEVNMEVVGKAGKSRIEPSLQDKLNTLTYALAFNKEGTVTDVTRRYSSAYNSRTRPARLTRYLAGSIWWNKLMGLYRPPITHASWAEEKFLRERVLAEGFPKNIQLFKNHPRYVLERHLRQDEVLKEKNPCGIMSMKTNSKPENVYPRSDVQQVKSANKWYQIGRIIKPGQICKKRKKMAKSRFRLDEEEDSPMYSFDQTEAYIPQPVVDGQVPRNGYGNVDLFTPFMMPPGGAHVRGKGAYMAAKSLGIDYANCVVGFDFTKGRQIKPRIDGVIVAEKYAKDVADVWSDMQEQTLAKEERNREVRALLRWRRYLTALKIRHRLDVEHGEVELESGEEEEEDEEVRVEEVNEEVKEKEENGVIIIDDNESDEPWYVPPSVLQPKLNQYLNKSAFRLDKPLNIVVDEPEEEKEEEIPREASTLASTPSSTPCLTPPPRDSTTPRENGADKTRPSQLQRASSVVSVGSTDTISSEEGNPLSELSSVIKSPVKIDYSSLAVADDSDSPDEMSESELYSE
ncbi:Conserved hypothetical protein [Yarrowia lipolytica]|nr:Conserved hypothetical protein [Yarrowia lipolytica]